ncbi:MAG: FeoA family protein [Legionellaceae bacterium]
MMMLTIRDLKVGDTVRLLSFGLTDGAYRRRLLSFGMTPGAQVQLIRRAPLGCPVQLLVRGASLILREDDVALVQWEYA